MEWALHCSCHGKGKLACPALKRISEMSTLMQRFVFLDVDFTIYDSSIYYVSIYYVYMYYGSFCTPGLQSALYGEARPVL